MTDFDRFWQAYPRRVAKAAARREFEKAVTKTTIDVILTAVAAYKRNKPDYQDWAHARTWLYNERWEDEWESEQTMSQEQIDYWQARQRSGEWVPDTIAETLPQQGLRIVET